MKHLWVITLLGALMSLTVGWGVASADDQSCHGVFANQTLSGQFEATINEGPDAGLSITGTIAMHVGPSGDFQGTLTLSDGSTVPFTGAINGREIQYTFALGGDATIFGTGVLPTPCTDPVTGLALGPNAPDRGDWGIIWGS